MPPSATRTALPQSSKVSFERIECLFSLTHYRQSEMPVRRATLRSPIWSSPLAVAQLGELPFTFEGLIKRANPFLTSAIVVEWNTADTAGQQGTAAMWDVHVRLGGFAGSNIEVNNCAKQSGHAVNPCIAAFIGLHITSTVSILHSPCNACIDPNLPAFIGNCVP